MYTYKHLFVLSDLNIKVMPVSEKCKSLFSKYLNPLFAWEFFENKLSIVNKYFRTTDIFCSIKLKFPHLLLFSVQDLHFPGFLLVVQALATARLTHFSSGVTRLCFSVLHTLLIDRSTLLKLSSLDFLFHAYFLS